MNTSSVLLIYLLFRSFLSQNFTTSLNDSILLHRNYIGISTIGRDIEGNFLVSFNNNQARKYTPDFTSYINLTIPQPVASFQIRKLQLSIILQNGTLIDLTGIKIILLSQNLQTIRIYNYNNYQQQSNYTFGEKIIKQLGFPITASNITYTYHIIIFAKTVVVMYKGGIDQYSYNGIVMESFVCYAATQNSYGVTSNNERFDINHILYMSLGSHVYQINITLTFAFSSLTNHFQLLSELTSFSRLFIGSTTIPIYFLQIASGLLIMQSNSTGMRRLLQPTQPIIKIYNINTLTMTTINGILPQHQIFRFFKIYNSYYLLQSVGILKLLFNSTSNTISMDTYTANLPLNTYMLKIGLSISAFYIVGQPYLYKAGPCQGSNLLVGNSCIAYNCSVDHCLDCPISPLLCNQCQYGFNLNSSYECFRQIYENNGSKNVGMKILVDFMDIIKFLISIPAARRVISPIFYFFGIFDDIYLFQFHDRLYGETMKTVFENLNQIQQKKWSLFNYQTALSLLGVDVESFTNITDYQHTYNEYGFTDVDHTQVGPQGLWQNCQNFFLVALPITLIGFFVGKLLFKLLFNYAASRWIRRFQFWPFLLLLLFEGNIQQFAFYQSTDWKNSFFFDISSKLMKAQTIAFGFIIVMASATLYFLSYSFYSKLNRHIMDNNRNTILGHTALMAQFGLRNFILGVVHSFLRGSQYSNMLAVLLACELAFVLLFAVALAQQVYIYKLRIWIYLFLNLNKVLLILTLFTDYRNINTPIIQGIQQFLIILLICLFIVGVLIQSFLLAKEVIQNVKIMMKQRKTIVIIKKKKLLNFKINQIKQQKSLEEKKIKTRTIFQQNSH